MNGSNITVVGNVTREPELRFTPGGDAVCDLGIASNRSYKVNDEWEQETTFYKAVFWGQTAENIADSVPKGCAVIVTGQLELEEWENDEGEVRKNLKIRADEIGISLKWQTARGVERNEKKSGGGSSRKKSGGNKKKSDARQRRDRDYDPNEEPF